MSVTKDKHKNMQHGYTSKSPTPGYSIRRNIGLIDCITGFAFFMSHIQITNVFTYFHIHQLSNEFRKHFNPSRLYILSLSILHVIYIIYRPRNEFNTELKVSFSYIIFYLCIWEIYTYLNSSLTYFPSSFQYVDYYPFLPFVTTPEG